MNTHTEIVGEASPVENRLIQELGSENSHVRSNAAQAIGKLGASAKIAVPHLIPLLKDKDWAVRSNAAFALGKMGASAKVAVPHLIPLLQDKERHVRGQARSTKRYRGISQDSGSQSHFTAR